MHNHLFCLCVLLMRIPLVLLLIRLRLTSLFFSLHLAGLHLHVCLGFFSYLFLFCLIRYTWMPAGEASAWIMQKTIRSYSIYIIFFFPVSTISPVSRYPFFVPFPVSKCTFPVAVCSLCSNEAIIPSWSGRDVMLCTLVFFKSLLSGGKRYSDLYCT